jgi:hypothetical protein
MSKEPGTAVDRLKREMYRASDHMRLELDRIEILATAMSAFAKPVPDYYPSFQHLRYASASAFEINGNR